MSLGLKKNFQEMYVSSSYPQDLVFDGQSSGKGRIEHDAEVLSFSYWVNVVPFAKLENPKEIIFKTTNIFIVYIT